MALGACSNEKTAAPPVAETRQILEGFSLRQSKQGSLSWSLSARIALLHENSRQVSITEPRLEFYNDSKLAARGESLRGLTDLGTSDVVLSSAVKVSSLRDGAVLTTDSLTYLSKNKQFTTESPVVLRRPGVILRGRGLRANHDLSEVRIRNQTTEVSPSPQAQP